MTAADSPTSTPQRELEAEDLANEICRIDGEYSFNRAKAFADRLMPFLQRALAIHEAPKSPADLTEAEWIVWWQGSGPHRGDHIMRVSEGGLGYAGEVAFIGADHHASAHALVDAHNETAKRVHKIRRALKAARNGEQEANERAEQAEAALAPCEGPAAARA